MEAVEILPSSPNSRSGVLNIHEQHTHTHIFSGCITRGCNDCVSYKASVCNRPRLSLSSVRCTVCTDSFFCPRSNYSLGPVVSCTTPFIVFFFTSCLFSLDKLGTARHLSDTKMPTTTRLSADNLRRSGARNKEEGRGKRAKKQQCLCCRIAPSNGRRLRTHYSTRTCDAMLNSWEAC